MHRSARTFSIVAGLALVTSYAHACVELNTSFTGADATNNCPLPMNISWCVGQGCTPPPGTAILVRPGHSLHLTNSTQPARIVSCRPPRVFDGRQCS